MENIAKTNHETKKKIVYKARCPSNYYNTKSKYLNH